MLEFVDSDLYFVQDKNNFINSLLQVGSGSVEKITGSGSWSLCATVDKSPEFIDELLNVLPVLHLVLVLALLRLQLLLHRVGKRGIIALI